MTYLVVGVGTIIKNGTSITNSPGAITRLKSFFSTNVAHTSTESSYPELQPRNYPLPAEKGVDTIKGAIIASAKSLGYEMNAEKQQNNSLHFTITTKIFKFKDDLTVELETNIDQVIINARSSSRTGKADFGANVANIRKFFNALDSQLIQH